MIRHTTRRPGVTLIEVLIATGILAVGMLAIMALFPIGAVSMARAINQNRAADHAANSDAIFRYYWKKAWIDPNGGGVRSSAYEAYGYTVIANPGTQGEEMIPLLDRKQPIVPGAIMTNTQQADIAPSASQPSYPVLVDPIGYATQVSFGPANKLQVSGSAILPARCSLLAAELDVNAPARTRIRLTTLLDDMSWDVNGEPSATTGQLDRGGRYTCAWMIQRPKNNIPHEVRLTVLVFGGRSPTDTPSAETAFQVSPQNGGGVFNYFDGIDPKPNTIVVNGVQTMPNIRRGSWVGFSLLIAPQGGTPYPTLDFYRVTSITDDIANSGKLALELEQPLRSYSTATIVGHNGGSFGGTVVFFDNLLEVFDRGMVSAQSISGR